MKIVIIGPAHPYRGGIADTNESMCQAFLDSGHDASIVTFKVQYPEFLFPGKTQFTKDGKPENLLIERWVNTINPINWVFIARRINKLSPDLVIIRYWLPFLGPCLGSISRLLKKKTVSIAMCDNVLPHEKRIGDNLLTQYFMNSFNGFMTLSRKTFDELNVFTKKPKVFYPHPINNNLGKKVEKETARKYLELDEKGNYLLFFGLIRDYKGLDLTLKALGVDKIKYLNIQLLVVGEFYEPKEKYEGLIDDLGLTSNIRIVDEFIPTSEIKYYFSAVDLIIQTYKTASQSGVSQIAFNFDCPILVTDVGGLSEIIKHKKVGYVCKKNPDDIADYIIDFFQENRKDVFVENIKIEKQKYSWKAFNDELLKLYRILS